MCFAAVKPESAGTISLGGMFDNQTSYFASAMIRLFLALELLIINGGLVRDVYQSCYKR